MNDTILCFSGGLDSVIAWYFLGKPKCIYFDCSNYSEAEKRSVQAINPDCIISKALDFREFEKGQNAYIPHRNIMMAAVASNYGSNVIIAGVMDDQIQDKNQEAFSLMSEVLSKTSKKPVKVTSPFWSSTKSNIVSWFLNNVKYAKDVINVSTSCYNNEQYCGHCSSCFRKACALWDNGIRLSFTDINLVIDYYEKAQRGQYSKERNESIIKYVKEIHGYIC